jgi:hypothetical protein
MNFDPESNESTACRALTSPRKPRAPQGPAREPAHKGQGADEEPFRGGVLPGRVAGEPLRGGVRGAGESGLGLQLGGPKVQAQGVGLAPGRENNALLVRAERES